MKLGPVTKLDKRNTARSKKIDEFSESCDIIVIFSIYSQFGAIRKPDPGRIYHKTDIFNNSAALSILQQNAGFLHTHTHTHKKNADINKIKMFSVLKIIFSETAYVCIHTYQIPSF